MPTRPRRSGWPAFPSSPMPSPRRGNRSPRRPDPARPAGSGVGRRPVSVCFRPVTRSAKRKLAIVLALVLVGAVALVAATTGLGEPGLPDGDVAYVDGVDDGAITQDDLDSAIQQAAAQGGLPKPPAPDDPQYASL